MKSLLLVIPAFLLFTFAVPDAGAFNMTIEPAKKVFELKRGDTKDYRILFRNNYDSTLYEAKVIDFVYSESGVRNFIEKKDLADPGQSLTSWVQLDHDRFQAEKGLETSIAVHISIPENAAFGDHFGVVLLGKPESKDQGEGAATVGGSIASVLAIKVLGGDSVKSGELVDYLISTQERARNPANFRVTFRNSGNEFYDILAEVQIFKHQNDPSPVKVVTKEFTVFPNVVWETKIPLGDMGEAHEEGEYFSKLNVYEYKHGEKVSLMGSAEKSFHYYLPIRDEVSVEYSSTGTGIISVLITLIGELGWTIAGFILVLVVLIRILFFEKRKK